MSKNVELTHTVEEARLTARPEATVETGWLEPSLEMEQSVVYPSEVAVLRGPENGLSEMVALPDGQMVGVRAVSWEDGDLLRRMFSRLSGESIYRRFHMPYPRVPEWAVARFAGVDEVKGEGLVAMAKDEIVGHAMYARLEDGCSADIGILIEDEWQRRGIGKLLLSRLADEAKRQGIETFTGAVLRENRPMMLLLAAVFLGVRSSVRGGQYQIHVSLPRLEAAQDPLLSTP